MGHTTLGSIKRAKLAWPKVERPREVRKGNVLCRLSENSVRINQEGENIKKNILERHVLDMAARYARFIFVREELIGKSILSFLSL